MLSRKAVIGFEDLTVFVNVVSDSHRPLMGHFSDFRWKHFFFFSLNKFKFREVLPYVFRGSPKDYNLFGRKATFPPPLLLVLIYLFSSSECIIPSINIFDQSSQCVMSGRRWGRWTKTCGNWTGHLMMGNSWIEILGCCLDATGDS